jgi:hypothetical protein
MWEQEVTPGWDAVSNGDVGDLDPGEWIFSVHPDIARAALDPEIEPMWPEDDAYLWTAS